MALCASTYGHRQLMLMLVVVVVVVRNARELMHDPSLAPPNLAPPLPVLLRPTQLREDPRVLVLPHRVLLRVVGQHRLLKRMHLPTTACAGADQSRAGPSQHFEVRTSDRGHRTRETR